MKPHIIGIGEILWDMLPSGPQMGGAPANFACHACSLGAIAHVVSRVGKGEKGNALLRQLSDKGVSIEGISVDDLHDTGEVEVRLDGQGQPQYTIQINAAWDNLQLSAKLLNLIATADAICFGTLGQRSHRSREVIRKLIEHASPQTIRVLDVNLRQHYYSPQVIHDSFLMANFVKLNDEELETVSHLLDITEKSPSDQLSALLDRYNLRLIACTRGAHGSLLYNGNEWSENPGVEIDVVDTIGAGDAFTAALTMGMLKDWPLAQMGDAASQIASYVCSRAGATPVIPEYLKMLFHLNGVAL